MKNPKTEHRHESFGMIQVSRRSSSRGAYLFGSPVTDHFATFSIQISTGYSYEDAVGTGELRFMDDKQIVEVEMSPAQFLEMVTNPNVGAGVPCTITRRQGPDGRLYSVKDPPRPRTDVERAHTAFEKRMSAFGKTLDTFIDDVRAASTKLPKRDQESLRQAAAAIHTEVASNIPFFLRTFHEAAERIVTSKKHEFDAWISGCIRAAGLTHLRQLAPGRTGDAGEEMTTPVLLPEHHDRKDVP